MTKTRLGTRKRCPVCQKSIGLSREGRLARHMWDRKVPRVKGGSAGSPFWKILRQTCPASGLTVDD